MIQCIVESCETNSNSDLRTSVTFFDFPHWKDTERFNKWVTALGKSPEYFKQKGKFICSRHFRLEDFHQKGDETIRDIKVSLRLMESAVPSLYLWEDNKNFTTLPISGFKIEQSDKEGLNEADQNSTSNNSNSFNTIIIKEEFICLEQQEETECESTAEDITPKESQGLAKPSFQETQTESNELVRKKFRCRECKETFSWSSELKKHKRVVHGSYACNICSKFLNSLFSLRAHKRQKHNINFVLRCKNCKEAFFNRDELLKHMQIHKKASKASKCSKCKNKFESDAEFSSHDCIIKKNEFQCEICSKYFISEKTLSTHKNKFHLKNKQEEKYKCDELKQLLKKQYQCFTCKRQYYNKRSLETHQLKHSAIDCIHLGEVKF